MQMQMCELLKFKKMQVLCQLPIWCFWSFFHSRRKILLWIVTIIVVLSFVRLSVRLSVRLPVCSSVLRSVLGENWKRGGTKNLFRKSLSILGLIIFPHFSGSVNASVVIFGT